MEKKSHYRHHHQSATAMAALRILFCVFLLHLLLLSPTALGYSRNEIISWCSQMPYPKPCEYFLTENPSVLPIRDKSDFLKIAIKLALGRAVNGEQNTLLLGLKCRNEKEKAAWEDCVELYKYTIEKLNKTIDPTIKCSDHDSQSWLSTALTNLETCWAGFTELGVADYLPPLMSNNVSKLISNTLSLNKPLYNPKPKYKHGFPTWVKPGDRKLLQAPSPAVSANIVVSQDGSGNYDTITAAVKAASDRSGTGRYVIYVKAGTYKENIEIKTENIMLVGDGIGKTIITGSKSVGGGTTTFRSATVAVVGDGFIARDITFVNTAGPENHQAVALRSGSDFSVFYKCSFEGYQDTLYVHSDRQFYRECDIYGTVDFIFGNAAAVLQSCNIFPRKPPNKTNTLTAQGRTDKNQNTGISIINCRVTAAAELQPEIGTVKTYLGRPWKEYSRTVFMKTYLDSLINPAGWLEWNGDFALKTLYYGEYMNNGPGSSTDNRVKWPGYHVITSASEASQFTVKNFIAGDTWLPATDVPYTTGI